MNIGNVLLAWGVISREQLETALKCQEEQAPDKKLGEVIVNMGMASFSQVELCLAKQEALRSGKAALPDIQRVAEYAAEKTAETARRIERMNHAFERILEDKLKQ